MPEGILISWISVKEDPCAIKDESAKSKKLPGPTLTVLFDPNSPVYEKVSSVYLLYQVSNQNSEGDYKKLATNLREAIRKEKDIKINLCDCSLDDPTDHEQIARVVIPIVDEIQKSFSSPMLYIHISPGTPSMHAVWLHLSEAGFIRGEHKIIKSYREGEHAKKMRVVEVPRGFSGRINMIGMDFQLLKGEPFDYLKCRSPLYRKLVKKIKEYADLNVPIILLGERGTGKTTIARFIRDISHFKNCTLDEWPVIACGQFSPQLVRSELFGHTKGAYSGAEKEKRGLLDVIDEDTLFLDEVTDLDLDTQRLLIRAIEEGRYSPLGSYQVKHSKFRLICATNRSPAEVSEMIHQDFWDRISYFKLDVPPLREVTEDIELFWKAVYEKSLQKTEATDSPKPSDQHVAWICEKLKMQPLRGNYRDLYRVAYHLIAKKWWRIPYEELSESWVNEILYSPSQASDCSEEDERWRMIARGLAGSSEEFVKVFRDTAPVDLKSFISWAQGMCAKEAKEYALRLGRGIDTVIDNPTSETLRKWRKNLG